MAEEQKQVKKMVRGPQEEKPMNRKLVVWAMILTFGIGLLGWWNGQRRDEPLLPWFSPVSERVVSTRSVSPTPITRSHATFVKQLQELVATQSGTYAVWVHHLSSGEGYGFNQEVDMEGASILKVPAMLTVLQRMRSGQLSASDTATLIEADRSPGSGPLQFVPAGTSLTWQRILSEMGKKSDNTGWRLTNRVIGRDVIVAYLRQIGAVNSDYRDGYYTTTAKDVVKIFQAVYQMPESYPFLEESIYEDRISAGVPRDVRVIHKVGTLPGVWEDAGILIGENTRNAVIVVILNKDILQDEAVAFVPELAKKIWKYASSL